MGLQIMGLKKGQIMLADLLMLMIIVLLVINIEFEIIDKYKRSMINSEWSLKYLEQNLIAEQIISDCNYLSEYDSTTKLCYKNKISLTNKNNLKSIDVVCKVNIANNIIYSKDNTDKKIINTFKRGVIYNNKFSIIEVSFCE